VRSVIHGEFDAEREFDHPLRDVWAGYSDPALRARWRSIPGPRSDFSVDVRRGGVEAATGTFAPNGVEETIRAVSHFLDIVEAERLVFAYTLELDGLPRWASLVTVTLDGGSTSTRVSHHEQFVFLNYSGDGADDVAHLRGSLNLQWNRFEAAISGPAVTLGGQRQV
jgi:uncharacterized protein YndB with AHSA1/START domain